MQMEEARSRDGDRDGGGGRKQGQRCTAAAAALELGGDSVQIWQPFRVEMNHAKNLVKEGGGSRVIYAPFTAAGNLTRPLR
jgi:hypothetical protein